MLILLKDTKAFNNCYNQNNPMEYSVIMFLAGLAVLAGASRFVLSSSIKISEYFKISELAVGYLLIAMATSVPDIMVAITASHEGAGGIAIGDVLGSSIANICLVLGIAAIIRNIRYKREQALESAELLLLVTIIPLVLLTRTVLGQTEGMILIVIFGFYALFAIKEKFTLGIKEGITHRQWIGQAIIFLISIVVTMISAQWMVRSGADLARGLGIDDAIIGMTIIAFGTTLPELAINFTAIRKGHFALAIGDIFGSCVVNLTLALGLAAMINPLSGAGMFVQTGIAFLVGVVIFLWYILMKHEGIKKEHGLIFLLAYIIFIMIEILWGFSAGVV